MNIYWIGNNGNWSDPNHWSDTSNGTSIGRIPNKDDTIIIDNNSGDNELTIILDMETIIIGNFFDKNRSKPYNILKDESLVKSELPYWEIYGEVRINEFCNLSEQGSIHPSGKNKIIIDIKNGSFESFTDLSGEFTFIENDIIFRKHITFSSEGSVFNVRSGSIVTAYTISAFHKVIINLNKSILRLRLINSDFSENIALNPSSSEVIITESGDFNSANTRFNKLTFLSDMNILDNFEANTLKFTGTLTLKNKFIKIFDRVLGNGTIYTSNGSTIDMGGNIIYSMINLDGVNVVNGDLKKGKRIRLKDEDGIPMFPITNTDNVLMRNGETVGNKITELEKSMIETKKREQFYCLKLNIGTNEGAILQFEDLEGIDRFTMKNVRFDEENGCIEFNKDIGSFELDTMDVDDYTEIQVELWADKNNISSINIKDIKDNKIFFDSDEKVEGLQLIVNDRVYNIDSIKLND